MDSRTAAHVLAQIGGLLELHGEDRFKSRAEHGVVLELNADPHRLDLDWTYCHDAKKRGVRIEIGPDAHSTHGLDNVELGIAIARKGWLEKSDVLNCGSAADVVAHARRGCA
jgi:DNA polymerase (family X)